MKTWSSGMAIVICLLIAGAVGAARPFDGGLSKPMASQTGASSEGLVAFCHPLESGRQLIVLDPQSQSIGVYHVDEAGQITLKGERNIRGDMQLDTWNGQQPLPSDIRSRLEKR
jgi:hypothetical protein